MVQQVTDGVKVSVETFYQPTQSDPKRGEFLFAYRITIENTTSFPVKLHSRYWHIADSDGSFREVKGEGVVGQQPIIESGGSYQYVSAANLNTEIGKMRGSYQMENLYTKSQFKVAIPEFQLIAPMKLN
jgi:ApaG protein